MGRHPCEYLCVHRKYPKSMGWDRYDSYYWCKNCGCAVPREEAEIKRDLPHCPCCHYQLRETPRVRKNTIFQRIESSEEISIFS